MKILNAGITSPNGFKAAGKHVGLKKQAKDLAIIYSETPALCSATFTNNSVKAAPVILGQETLANGNKISVAIINSGNANACTGAKGYEDSKTAAAALAKELDIEPSSVLVSSTGVIGAYLDMEILLAGIKSLVLELSSGEAADQNFAEAIMTTDTFPKTIAVEIDIEGNPVKIAGVCKGSGMINPNMATMLAYITTDVDISKELLDRAFKESVKKSFNMITVDGETSTNDTAAIFANGLSKNKKICFDGEDYNNFKKALEYVCKELAKKIVKDGEGATKLIQISVKNSKSDEDANLIFNAIANSNLVKTAFWGEDANWGRIVSAMGASGGYFNMQKMKIIFKSAAVGILLFKNGEPVAFDEVSAKSILREKSIEVAIELSDGNVSIVGWTCDLSCDYVKINGSYRS